MRRPASRRRFVKTTVGAAVVTVGGRASAQQAGRVRGFDHVAVPMQNTEAMTTFYRALGLQLNETPIAVSVYIGDQMINFHRPVRRQDPADTLGTSLYVRGPDGNLLECIIYR